MKINTIIDLIHGEVNGGRSSTDSAVTKSQIKALLPAAVNYALTGDYWANIQAEGDREIPATFITELPERGINVDDRGRDYIVLAEALSHVGGNGGIRYIQDSAGNHYAPRPQGTSPSHWDCVLTELREYQLIGKKAIIFNRPPLVKKFYPGVILDVSAMSNDDEAPIPTGREPEVIDILRSFFKNQRMSPKDYIINGVDPVNDTTNG